MPFVAIAMLAVLFFALSEVLGFGLAVIAYVAALAVLWLTGHALSRHVGTSNDMYDLEDRARR